MKPQPTEAEIQFILDAISEYLTVKVRSSALLPSPTFSACRERRLCHLPACSDGHGVLRERRNGPCRQFRFELAGPNASFYDDFKSKTHDVSQHVGITNDILAQYSTTPSSGGRRPAAGSADRINSDEGDVQALGTLNTPTSQSPEM